MLMNLSDYFLIGKIGKAKSFKGEVFFIVEDEEVFYSLDDFQEMNLLINGKLIVYPLQTMKVNNGKVVLKFKGFDTPEMTDMIKNCEVYINKEDLPESNEEKTFSHELIDCSVIDLSLGEIGRVDYIDKSSAQTLVYLKHQEEEFIFPLIDEFIIDIDLKKKVLTTQLPEGLLDINR